MRNKIVFSIITLFALSVLGYLIITNQNEVKETVNDNYQTEALVIFEDEDIIVTSQQVEAEFQGSLFIPSNQEFNMHRFNNLTNQDAFLSQCGDIKVYKSTCILKYKLNDTEISVEFHSEGPMTQYHDMLKIFIGGVEVFKTKFDPTTYNPASTARIFEYNGKVVIDFQAAVFDEIEQNYRSSDSILIITSEGVINLVEEFNLNTAFEPFVFNNKLLYLFSDKSGYGINWDGEIVGQRYDDISNYVCCEPVAWSVQGQNEVGVTFFSRKGQDVFKVLVEKK